MRIRGFAIIAALSLCTAAHADPPARRGLGLTSLEHVGVVGLVGAPWTLAYQDRSGATSGAITGALAEVGFGRPVFGWVLGVGATRAVLPAAADPAQPMWTFGVHLGVRSAPVALVRQGGLELRPLVGAGVFEQVRLGCDRCGDDPADPGRIAEPSHGFGVQLRGGAELWLGHARRVGVAVEVVYERMKMKAIDASMDPRAGVLSELTVPTVLVQLTAMVRGAGAAAQ
ncbi:MAG: hypothetical protein K8W52_02485 [Deltaproteobacteria bacterium]|nr:hypothetical protein [Deltaproteobacteria bacterium]